ncbi:type VII secretion-associated serine protease mycosin [Gordonia sp. X0973]|uniref:type VII secretion-associated serine protease mycosin n=1 Tax=Gordonia sp. X0973 TaxID=2742602 RepID=UPI0026576024|nr:type VII secretion-associated serine protease mycosin [Gordonia sp. X0973]
MKAVRACVAAGAILVAALSGGPAVAVRPPQVAQTAPPSDSVPAGTAEQRTKCAVPIATSRTTSATRAVHAQLEVDRLHRISTGRGQRVAVIDTGVSPHPRLPAVLDGGDFVTGGSGRTDCDAHGTLVAGLIAARPSATDDFTGLAPDVSLISIRQSSAAFAPRQRSGDQEEQPVVGGGYGTVAGLAAAVMRAVRLGATVVNISEVACAPAAAASALHDGELGVALRHAVDRDVVVVVAAGNVSSDGGCREQNPPAAARQQWSAVRTVATPAWFSDYVLTVGAVDSLDGKPSGFSLGGPWVSVAAPGTDLTSLDPRPGQSGLVSGLSGAQGAVPVSGTSFAAAYVTATVALVRSRFPDLDARAVMRRITATAIGRGTAPDARTGCGVVDPLAALTVTGVADDSPSSIRFRPAPPAPDPDLTPRIAAIGGAFGLAVLLGAVIAFRKPRHRMVAMPDDGL